MTIINQLKIYGDDIEDQKVVEKVLKTLLRKFDMVVATIEEAKDSSQLLVDDMLGSLLSNKSRINGNDDFSLENVFKALVSISKDRAR